MALNDADCQILSAEIGHIKMTVEKIEKKLDSDFVTKEEFWPVRTVVYSACGSGGLILLAYLIKNLLGQKP